MIEIAPAQPTQVTRLINFARRLNFTDWDVPAESWPVRFMEDAEWGWRTGRFGLEDW
jgi:hypothetical protein